MAPFAPQPTPRLILSTRDHIGPLRNLPLVGRGGIRPELQFGDALEDLQISGQPGYRERILLLPDLLSQGQISFLGATAAATLAIDPVMLIPI